MLQFNGTEMTREDFMRLRNNMVVYENAILEYDEEHQKIKATVFDSDERTQKILTHYGLQ